MNFNQLVAEARKINILKDGRTREGKLSSLIARLTSALVVHQELLLRAELAMVRACSARNDDVAAYLSRLEAQKGYGDIQAATVEFLSKYEDSDSLHCALCGGGREDAWASAEPGFTREGLRRHLLGELNSNKCVIVDYFQLRAKYVDEPAQAAQNSEQVAA